MPPPRCEAVIAESTSTLLANLARSSGDAARITIEPAPFQNEALAATPTLPVAFYPFFGPDTIPRNAPRRPISSP